jgi:hypothetical protein
VTSWANIVRRVADGQPVNAASDGAPISDLEQRTAYLREALDAATAGRAIIDFDVPLDAATVVCTPCYVDVDGVWKPALADVYAEGVMSGRLKPCAYVAGVVINKTAANRGDILLGGIVDGLPLANVTDGLPVVVGNYFLSSTTPGVLVSETTGAASIAVGQLLADGGFLFSRWPKNGAEDHLHFKFTLSGAPAVDVYTHVTPPTVGAVHVISNAYVDLSKPGWVPVTHPATPPLPAGAKFWYNIAADPILAQAFPPVPVLAYFATQGRGVVLDTDLVITAHGIFWMNNAYGTVPWPVNYGSAGNNVTDDFGLFFAKMSGDTFSRVVRSLTPKTGSKIPFVITTSDGADGITGDLIISVDNFLPVVATDDAAPLAVKTLGNNEITRGPVVTGVVATSAGLRITAEAAAGGYGYGKIGIAIDAGLINNFIQPSEVRHVGTREDQYQDFSYLAFPAGRATQAVFSFVIPTLGTPALSQFELNLTWLGVAALATFGLTVQAKKLSVGGAVPTTWTNLGTASSSVATGQTVGYVLPVRVTNVAPGDEILIMISRPVDAVNAVAGLLRVNGVLIQ